MKKVITILACTAMLLACTKSKVDASTEKSSTPVETTTGQTTSVKTIELNTESFLTKVANYKESPNAWKYLGDKPAIIDLYATWCGPCKQMAPILESLAAEYGDSIYVYKVDVDQNNELADLFGVSSIPTLLFIPMQDQPTALVGLQSKAILKDKIDNFLLKK